MTRLPPIPTVTVWDVLGRDSTGRTQHFERFKLKEDAVLQVKELESMGNTALEYSIAEYESIVPDNAMPTDQQRRDLYKLMHLAFVALRKLAYEEKHTAIAELADAFHNLPNDMLNENVWDWNLFEAGLRDFEEKFPNDKVFPFSAMLREIRGD